ncbi:MAG: hypothetical protein QOD35_2038 [Nocardioidaceae bacterium]|nr:hypothetical protein [Nocardioidaceae bacterium]
MAEAQAVPAPVDPVERTRRWLAPPVALLASVLAATCMLNVVAVARWTTALTELDAHFVGWVGVGALGAVATAAVALASGDRVGSGPFLSLGAVAAVFGLSLGHHVSGSAELTAVILVCGLSVGALLAGAVAVVSTLPAAWAALTLTAWAGPLVVVWPLLATALAGRAAGSVSGLLAHPQTSLLAVVAVLIVSWSLLTMLVEPVPVPDPTWASWQASWWALLLLASGAALVTAVLGFSPQLSLVWLRPIVVTATAAVVAGWMLTAKLVPESSARLSYIAVSAVSWVVPATAMFAVSVAGADKGVAGTITVLFLVAAVCGVAIGYRGSTAVIPVGFALMVVAGCGIWVMPTGQWVMLASVGPLVVVGTAVLVSAVRIVGYGGPASRLVGLAIVGSLVLGQVVAIPLDWAMLGDVPSSGREMIASGRLDAGLTVAVASLAASWTWVVRRRLQRAAMRVPRWPGVAAPQVVGTDGPVVGTDLP